MELQKSEIINIIHMPDRADRMEILLVELKNQKINNFNLWDGVHDQESIIKGINKAHKQIVQYAKDEGLKEVIIAEDDIKFLGEGAYDYFIENKPQDFDIYLAGIFLGIINDDNIVKEFTGMTLYIVAERFYDIFLNSDNDKHIDHALSNKGLYKVCNPFVAIQHNGVSDNQKCYCNYDIIFENRNLYKSA